MKKNYVLALSVKELNTLLVAIQTGKMNGTFTRNEKAFLTKQFKKLVKQAPK